MVFSITIVQLQERYVLNVKIMNVAFVISNQTVRHGLKKNSNNLSLKKIDKLENFSMRSTFKQIIDK